MRSRRISDNLMKSAYARSACHPVHSKGVLDFTIISIQSLLHVAVEDCKAVTLDCFKLRVVGQIQPHLMEM